MKYLKVFESYSRKDQIEDIESIFSELLETQNVDYMDTKDDYDFYLFFTFYRDDKESVCDNLTELNSIFDEIKVFQKLLSDIKIALTRLDHLGYKWGFSMDSEAIYIKAFYKDIELTLTDAFGGIRRMNVIDESIMKKVLMDEYGVRYDKYTYREGQSGSYGRRARFEIFLKDNLRMDINGESQLEIDIRNLKNIQGDRAFHRVEALESFMIRIDV